jgi:phage terminase large subunit
MSFTITTAEKKLAGLHKRIRGIAGGTSAGKTYGILRLLIDDAESDKTPTLTSVVSESYPHLSRGAMRDFLNILEDSGHFEPSRWNKTEHTYTVQSGSKIEFFSADMPSKVRGPRRDRLFINEVNNIPYEAYDQLEIRTKEYIWLDWNPTNEFYFYTDIKDKDNVDFIILTYKDNEGLDSRIVESIESRKGNKNWWLVYGLGQLGEVEGKIYKDWNIIDEVPHEARLERYGLDFGYSQDPATLVGIYYYNGGYIVDEELYQTGMVNNQLADFIKNRPKALIMADSAEPKSIEEIKQHGINILPVTKGQDSVTQGINYVQQQRISMTKRSLNLIKEYRNYMWMTDRGGKILTKPDSGFDHTMDALRYGMESLKPSKKHAPIQYTGGDPVTGFGRRPIRKRFNIDMLE